MSVSVVQFTATHRVRVGSHSAVTGVRPRDATSRTNSTRNFLPVPRTINRVRFIGILTKPAVASQVASQGQTRDPGFKRKSCSIDATFLATSRLDSAKRFPRFIRSDALSGWHRDTEVEANVASGDRSNRFSRDAKRSAPSCHSGCNPESDPASRF